MTRPTACGGGSAWRIADCAICGCVYADALASALNRRLNPLTQCVRGFSCPNRKELDGEEKI